MNDFNLTKYIDIALRRKYWVIIPFLIVVLAGLGYLLFAPKTFEAKTLILVQEQKVPQDFVRAIVSSELDDRLRTISQQVTSRTNLEAIIQEYQLYNSPAEASMILDDKVELLRSKIIIDVVRGSGSGGNAFSISFQGKDPGKVMQVTNALASNFISENLKIRESQALGTSTFLADELDSITISLNNTEEKLKEYNLKYMGSLPDQLPTNLSILERLQMQQEQLSSSLNDAENRKLIIQQQLADSDLLQRQLAGTSGTGSIGSDLLTAQTPAQNSGQGGIIELKRELASLESRYTENHPDVKRLKQMIANLEDRSTDAGRADEQSKAEDTAPALTESEIRSARAGDVRSTQLQQVELEINTIKKEITDVQSRIKVYQTMVEDTPKREQELLSLKRDYENLRELYNSMLNRKLEAEIAVSMEKKQKGEQFRVVDPAKMPSRPISPDSRKVMLITIVLGLGLGGGLAYLLEFMDSSYRSPEELEKELQLPVLVSLPFRYTEIELRRMKMQKILIAVSVAVGFIAASVGIVLAGKGFDETVNFVKGFF
jgi:polysaccharide chain length determinant protein (PEP-CTERM system associated)